MVRKRKYIPQTKGQFNKGFRPISFMHTIVHAMVIKALCQNTLSNIWSVLSSLAHVFTQYVMINIVMFPNFLRC